MLSRRQFLRFLAGLGAFSASTTAYGFGIEPVLRLRVARYDISPPQWPADFPLKVAVIADLHACDPWMTLDRIAAIVDRTNALNADIIVMLGDYVAGHRHVTRAIPAREWAPVLAGLKAPLGVHAILGNHDHWTDAKLIADLFRAEGISMLINEGTRIDARGESFWLAGVDDTMVGLEDLPLALAGSRDDEFRLLLAHNPIILRRAARAEVDLVLSGHTHGGQVTLRPEKNLSGKPRRRMLRGLGRRANTQIYVTRGLGTVVLPIRYGCPPEVSLLELRCLR